MVDDRPALVYAHASGNIIDAPDLEMVGAAAGRWTRLQAGDWMPLPEGSELFLLPQRRPVGYNREKRRFETLASDPFAPEKPVQAVSAFVAPAHTQLYSSAYRAADQAPLLPLFAYTAVGWWRDRLVAAAVRIDPDVRQDLAGFDLDRIRANARKRMAAEKDNRLIQHLGRCALSYGCPAAKNLFQHRFEAPLPTSPICNAHCLGCISFQDRMDLCATQDRIRFVPSVAEILAVALPHLQTAAAAVVSFGQGCEGEPLLQAPTLIDAVARMRRETPRGTINLNTNGSLPEHVAQLRDAGLDSIRVSLNSCQPEYYQAYYRPKGYGFEQVTASLTAMKDRGGFASINYFVLPGVTDDPAEVEALWRLLDATRLDLIQLRNFNIDPLWYLNAVGFRATGRPLGMRRLIEQLRHRYPQLRLGYFNPCLDPAAMGHPVRVRAALPDRA